jgi:hypothetical protein
MGKTSDLEIIVFNKYSRVDIRTTCVLRAGKYLGDGQQGHRHIVLAAS